MAKSRRSGAVKPPISSKNTTNTTKKSTNNKSTASRKRNARDSIEHDDPKSSRQHVRRKWAKINNETELIYAILDIIENRDGLGGFYELFQLCKYGQHKEE